MDDLRHIEGKAVKSIEENNTGLNSYLIIKCTDGSKLNISGYPHGNRGVAQLDIELEDIKVEEIKNRKILTIEEEFDGQMDKIIIKFKDSGRMVVGSFNSKENETAGIETTVYIENKKKLVGESLLENEYKTGENGDYIMNSPQYEEEESENKEETENKDGEMEKIVKESIDDESLNELWGYGKDVEETMYNLEDTRPSDDEISDELSMDDVEENSYFDIESLIDNDLSIPETDRQSIQFRLKNSTEQLEGVPMARVGDKSVLFKIDNKLRKINVSDIITESQAFDLVKESVEYYMSEAYKKRKKKLKGPPKRGEMKMVKVDSKTTIEVPVTTSDEDAIAAYKKKLEKGDKKW